MRELPVASKIDRLSPAAFFYKAEESGYKLKDISLMDVVFMLLERESVDVGNTSLLLPLVLCKQFPRCFQRPNQQRSINVLRSGVRVLTREGQRALGNLPVLARAVCLSSMNMLAVLLRTRGFALGC